MAKKFKVGVTDHAWQSAEGYCGFQPISKPKAQEFFENVVNGEDPEKSSALLSCGRIHQPARIVRVDAEQARAMGHGATKDLYLIMEIDNKYGNDLVVATVYDLSRLIEARAEAKAVKSLWDQLTGTGDVLVIMKTGSGTEIAFVQDLHDAAAVASRFFDEQDKAAVEVFTRVKYKKRTVVNFD